ncbi:prenyltransferase/squalene oxidase repeat-containing protein [Oceaniferula spumae]
MKIINSLISMSLLGSLSLSAQTDKDSYLSIKKEIAVAIDKGNAYLKSKQAADGHWDEEKFPAITALAATAALRAPSYEKSPHIDKSLSYLLKLQKEDGGIYNAGHGVYNTATSIVAFVATGEKSYHPAILKGRAYLINQQTDLGEKAITDESSDGGIGYGGNPPRSDMSNTHLALEALRLSRAIAQDDANGKQPELNWDAAITFISRVQNLKATNDQPNVSNDGSFNYAPAETKATELNINPDGSKTMRGYGSMSYAGLLSMIYAELDNKDPRVVAVKKWLGENYTVKENPGLATKADPELGQQGVYYYLHAMAKALAAANIDTLPLKNGQEADWRKDIARELLTKQKGDGSWVNDNGRWMENNSVLVTTYAVLTLEQIYHSIPE